jgi:hypothetical protein
MTPDTWKLIASIGGVLLTVVTGPIIWAIRAEAGKLRTEMKLLQAELEVHLTLMEKRLNERIDTRLVHR